MWGILFKTINSCTDVCSASLIRDDVKLAQLVSVWDCSSRGRRFNSGRNSKLWTPEDSNLPGFEPPLHRPSSKGFESLFEIIKAILINSASRPHFQLIWPAFVPSWISRRATATLCVNVFTLITTVSLTAEKPSVVHTKIFSHTSSARFWFRPVCACLSHSASWWWNVPFDSNVSRILRKLSLLLGHVA